MTIECYWCRYDFEEDEVLTVVREDGSVDKLCPYCKQIVVID